MTSYVLKKAYITLSHLQFSVIRKMKYQFFIKNMRQFVILTTAGPACSLFVVRDEGWLPPLNAPWPGSSAEPLPMEDQLEKGIITGRKAVAFGHFFLTAALSWDTGLGLPGAWAVNKTAHFTPSTAARNTRWLLSPCPGFSRVKQRVSQGSTKSRPWVLCSGAFLLSSLIRSCPEWPSNLGRVLKFVST